MDLSTLLEEFLQTVREPTADPRRTVLLIAIGLVLFLIAALLVFILLPSDREEDDEEPASDEVASVPAKRSSPLYVGGGLLLLLLVVIGFAYADRRSREDSVCLRCHVLQPVAKSWKAGSHSKVGCIECHTSPGVLGAVETRVRGLANAANNLGETKTLTAPATVNLESCRSCHERAMKEVLTVGRIRVRHAEFADRVPCGQCHGRVGHDPADVGAVATPAVMTSCADCHDGVTAPRDCATCHVGDIAQAGDGPGQFAPVKLDGPATCDGCHSTEGCTECHGIEMPHPTGWADPKNHAPEGAFDTDLCVRCHDDGCAPCHSDIHGNHGAEFRIGHQTAERSTCLNCHDAQAVGPDMCRLCHAEGAGGD